MGPPQLRQHASNCSLLLIYRPRKDERLSWPGWLTYSGCFTHVSGQLSATSRAQDKECSPAKDRRYTLVPRDQHVCQLDLFLDTFYQKLKTYSAELFEAPALNNGCFWALCINFLSYLLTYCLAVTCDDRSRMSRRVASMRTLLGGAACSPGGGGDPRLD